MINDEYIIVDEILNYIKTNNYTKDKKLPGERFLSTLFSVSRFTIRKSLKLLIEMNILYVKDKSGYYYNGDKQAIDISAYSDIVTFVNKDSKFILEKKVSADKKIANRMGIKYQEQITQYIFLNSNGNLNSIVIVFMHTDNKDVDIPDIKHLISTVISKSPSKKGKIYIRDANEFEIQLMTIGNDQKVCRWISSYRYENINLYIENSMNIEPFQFYGW